MRAFLLKISFLSSRPVVACESNPFPNISPSCGTRCGSRSSRPCALARIRQMLALLSSHQEDVDHRMLCRYTSRYWSDTHRVDANPSASLLQRQHQTQAVSSSTRRNSMRASRKINFPENSASSRALRGNESQLRGAAETEFFEMPMSSRT